jgi:VacB/RNase II family 3'-5' exoribonuclease
VPPADNHTRAQHHAILQGIARRVMLEAGLLADFPPQALAELGLIDRAAGGEPGVRDLRALPWCSIDNDDSRDLDQLTVAETADGAIKVLVAVADVDALVKRGSALDGRARHNTTSVYTPAAVFPMLPERLSTDLTSLNPGVDRLAVTVEMTVAEDGALQGGTAYRCLVRNQARLAYDAVGAWLEGEGPEPDGVAAVPHLAENLRMQDRAAQELRKLRHQHGALGLETIEARAVFQDGAMSALRAERKNRAKELIEDFMIAANGVTARFLSGKGIPSLRRVVRTPKRWDRIRELAAEAGSPLPEQPDPGALAGFLARERARDPLRFADLSLAVIKLLGPGEYVVEVPGQPAPGHFGLAVKDYAHSTAPNRRYPDLVTQRLLKASLAEAPQPYRPDDLAALARHCTEEEDVVKKVERQVEKSAAAIFMESRIGERFEAIATGAAAKGTWVRLLDLPVEGKLVQGAEGVDVGRRVTVVLLRTDVERGHIDFMRV